MNKLKIKITLLFILLIWNKAFADTPESCFTFNNEIKTITSYNIELDWCWTDVVIPKTIGWINVENIWTNSFKNKWINSVILNSNLKNIKDYAFDSNNLKNIELPKYIENISREAFKNNLITEVYLPEHLVSISYSFDDNVIPKWINLDRLVNEKIINFWNDKKFIKNIYKIKNNNIIEYISQNKTYYFNNWSFKLSLWEITTDEKFIITLKKFGLKLKIMKI